VPIDVRSEVVRAEAIGQRVRLTVRSECSGERYLEVDRVIAGTGYDWDLSRLRYINAELRASLQLTVKAPTLNMSFESSRKGLYFIGPISAMSFGPLFRFVAGADFTVRSLARHLARPLARFQATEQHWDMARHEAS